MKKKSGSKKTHIKHEKFRDRNISPIESHKQAGKTLKNPFSVLSNVITPRSWVNECIPNSLWACILAVALDRDHYLRLFRSVTSNAREKIPTYDDTFVTHNHLQRLSVQDFDTMFESVLGDAVAKRALCALLLVNCLPDRSHWERHLSKPSDEHWQILAKAVAQCFDHQSQKATDIRWLKLVHMVIIGKMRFGPAQADFLEELRLYPHKGDMRSVRPMIRAAEIGFRMFEFGEEGENNNLPPPHSEKFWREMYPQTACMPLDDREAPENGPKETTIALVDLAENLSQHFHETIEHTGLDARHDSAFGLVLYAIQILSEASATHINSSAIGRGVLRTIVECFITLAYLISKDDPKLWLKHRDYENVPRFIDLELLEQLANEDKWQEFHDMHLGSWSEVNLRTMAAETGLKEVYDGYYDICSGYTHGNWTAIRDSAFVTCANPLHRFHRIPAPPKFNMKSILHDGATLVNLMIDELVKIYPEFTQRLNTTVETEAPKDISVGD